MCVCVGLHLTPTVLGVHGITIVTRPTDLTVFPVSVVKASQTLSSDDVTVTCLTDVYVTMTLTADTGPAHYLRVTIETISTPGDTEW